MKKIITILGLIGLICCYNIYKSFDAENPLFAKTISLTDTTTNPCHQFKELKTAEEYFQSANIRTRGCPNDSLMIVIAAKEYELAVKIAPKFWQARRNYARQLIALKQYDLAIEQLTEALKLVSSETNPDLNLMRGQANYGYGNYQNAIADFDIAIKYQSNIDYTLLCKAKAQWRLGQHDNACINYKKAIELTPHLANKKEFIICK